MKLPEKMRDEVWDRLNEVERARNACADLLNDPEGKNPERLEDALNWLQDAAYHARGAFKIGAVR